MSTEILMRLYDAWNRVDLDAGLALLHPDVEIHMSGDFPGLPEVFHTREGARAFHEATTGVWESFDIEPHRLEDLGDRVLALIRFVGHGRDGLTVERDGGHIVRVEDGLITELIAYGSWDEALAAVARE